MGFSSLVLGLKEKDKLSCQTSHFAARNHQLLSLCFIHTFAFRTFLFLAGGKDPFLSRATLTKCLLLILSSRFVRCSYQARSVLNRCSWDWWHVIKLKFLVANFNQQDGEKVIESLRRDRHAAGRPKFPHQTEFSMNDEPQWKFQQPSLHTSNDDKWN